MPARKRLGKVEAELRASERARERAESELATYKQPPSLYPVARQILTHLCNRYPAIQEVHVIAMLFDIPHFAAEKALLDLKEMGIARQVIAPYSTIDSGWTLTEKGLGRCSEIVLILRLFLRACLERERADRRNEVLLGLVVQ